MLPVKSINAAALAASILLSAVFCAPPAQKSTSTTSASTTVASINKTIQKPASALPIVANLLALQQQRASVAVPLQMVNTADEQQLSASFDGKNPFSDDSLWRIPIQLVRDSSAGNREPLTKSASETKSLASGDHLSGDEMPLMSDLDEVDDTDEPTSSASPTVISASTSVPAPSADLKAAAGYHHATPHHGYGHHSGGHHNYPGKYYQYASVPYPYAWEFGYRRGNPYHTIERREYGKGPHFQTKVKWSDKYAGYGVHVWDYNHDDHHGHHYGSDHGYGHGHGSHHGYGHSGPHQASYGHH